MPIMRYATMPIMPLCPLCPMLYAHYALCPMPYATMPIMPLCSLCLMPSYIYFQGLSSFLYLNSPTLPLGNRGRFHFISSVLMSYFKIVLSVWTGFFFIFNNFLIILNLFFKLFSELFI